MVKYSFTGSQVQGAENFLIISRDDQKVLGPCTWSYQGYTLYRYKVDRYKRIILGTL